MWEEFAAEGLGDFDLIQVQFASETDGWGRARTCLSEVHCAYTLFATRDGGHHWAPDDLLQLPP